MPLYRPFGQDSLFKPYLTIYGPLMRSEQFMSHKKEVAMTRSAIRRIAKAGLLPLAMLASPLHADSASITVRHIDLHPANAAEATHAMLRIDDAALRVCGASGFSLAEAKAAMRASPCWQEAAGNAVLRSGDPLLEQAFDRLSPPRAREAG